MPLVGSGGYRCPQSQQGVPNLSRGLSRHGAASSARLLQVYTLERLAAGDLEGAGPLLAALAAALGRLPKGAPEWAAFAATLVGLRCHSDA